jgi:hypothetical protein
MGATEEQMQLLSAANVTHVSYILILYSVAFLLYLFVNILLYVYASHVWPEDESCGLRPPTSSSRRGASVAGPSASRPDHSRKMSVLPMSNGDINGSANGIAIGHARLPKHKATDSQHVRDAEEFELEGLISDEEGPDSPTDSGESGSDRKKEGAVALA